MPTKIVKFLLILFCSTSVMAKEPLLIVTDGWPPYAIDSEGKVKGTDVEITNAVFKQLGIPVKIRFYPWSRALLMVKKQQADAILDASITPERKEFLYFPGEPVSMGTTTFFVRKKHQIPFKSLDDLNDLTAGALLGYHYCTEIDQAIFMQKAHRVNSLEQNFRKLMENRLDLVIAVDAVGYFTAKQLGINDQITVVPNASYCNAGNYLAFSKKPGNKGLATTFSQALQAFKKTGQYRQILKSYGR